MSLVLVHDLVRMMRNWRLGMQSSLKDIVVKMMVLVHDLVVWVQCMLVLVHDNLV